MITFINYISGKTSQPYMHMYHKQHRLFATSVFHNQPEGKVALIKGEHGLTMFVEALTKLKEYKRKLEGPVVYIDNDCFLQRPIDHLFETDFDVGVVYRHAWRNKGTQDCLGGFLFFSQKRPAIEERFLDTLIASTEASYNKEISEGRNPWFYDQIAISDLVGEPPVTRTRKDYYMGNPYERCLKDVDGVKILFLSANEYACPMMYYPPPKVYIFHYNHSVWALENGQISVDSETLSEEELSELQTRGQRNNG